MVLFRQRITGPMARKNSNFTAIEISWRKKIIWIQ